MPWIDQILISISFQFTSSLTYMLEPHYSSFRIGFSVSLQAPPYLIIHSRVCESQMFTGRYLNTCWTAEKKNGNEFISPFSLIASFFLFLCLLLATSHPCHSHSRRKTHTTLVSTLGRTGALYIEWTDCASLSRFSVSYDAEILLSSPVVCVLLVFGDNSINMGQLAE